MAVIEQTFFDTSEAQENISIEVKCIWINNQCLI